MLSTTQMRFFSIGLITAIIISITGCAGSNYPSISSVSQSWLDVKHELTSSFINPGAGAPALESQIEHFTETLAWFFSSPVAYLYQVNSPDDIQYIDVMGSALEELRASLIKGPREAIFSNMLEIDRAIGQMQRIDTDLSNRSRLQFFHFFLFFMSLVIGIAFAMRLLYVRLEKAKSREEQSLIFSRENVMALEHERERIARELHDTVAQDLWRLSFQVDGIDKDLDPKERKRLCGEIISGQKEIMQRIKGICNSLIPPDFKHRGFTDSLHSLCHDFKQHMGIECQLTVQKGLELGSLDIDMQLQAFRIVQECLTNIQKHSNADEALVLVHTQEDERGQRNLVICVSDNGRGFSAPDRDSCATLREKGKFGLWSMFERIAIMDGDLSIDSSDGEGVMVKIQIPL